MEEIMVKEEKIVEQPEQNQPDSDSFGSTERMRRFTFRGCFLAKLLAFILFSASTLLTIAGGLCCIVALDSDMYSNSDESCLLELLRGEAYNISDELVPLVIMDDKQSLKKLIESNCVQVDVGYPRENGKVEWVWSSYAQPGSLLDHKCLDVFYFFRNEALEEQAKEKYGLTEDYVISRVYFNLNFPKQTRAKQIYTISKCLYDYRYECLGVTILCLGISIFLFVFLLCGVGHKNGKEGIQPSALRVFHFDVLTALVFFIVVLVTEFGYELMSYHHVDVELPLLIGVIDDYILFCTIIGMLYLMEFVNRVKRGKWWRGTLVYAVLARVLRLVWKILCGFGKVFQHIKFIRVTLLVALGVCFCEFVGLVGVYRRDAVMGLWVVEKLILLPYVFYLAFCCKKLFLAGQQLADGKENTRVDTTHMIGSLKEHGEDLNNISGGISKAVEARMRSERLKTELITNVSHDIKTPLTSIINYATLISELPVENEQLSEYSEVLVRQSNRLKKLLEDLVEASKASTGNLEVHLKRCDVGVLLTQTVGEYETRMAERGLDIRCSVPEESVFVQADGRHLWRVFDNLMNNILKYAQENSRVYLSLNQKAGTVEIIFRNMSKYALDISAEELQGRFARGDKSRHLEEGNGLGLSIAKSLTELQHGTFEIIVDGDLFKVVLTFPTCA